MEETVKVNEYNFKSLPNKHWKFYHGMTRIKNKKLVEKMIRSGSKSVYAKWKGKI